MVEDSILRAHLAQLAQSVSPIYDLISRLPDAEAQREAGLLADLVVAGKLTAPQSLPQRSDELGALQKSVAAAWPDRACMQLVVDSFESWLAAVSPSARDQFIATFPALAPAANALGENGIRRILEAVNIEPGLLRCVAAYAVTTPEAIRAVANMAHRAANHHRPELLEKLVEVFPAGRMEESRDAERLLMDMDRATEAAGEAWPQAIELALAVTVRDVSGARGVLRALPGSIRRVPIASLRFYLEDYRLLVDHIGPGVNGVCLNQLPGWFAKFGDERTRALLSAACQAAHSWGQIAGQYLLERKTPAAQQILS